MAKVSNIKKVKKIVQSKKGNTTTDKVCSLKELGQYSTAATCNVPKQCKTCSWYQDKAEVENRKVEIERWKKLGF